MKTSSQRPKHPKNRCCHTVNRPTALKPTATSMMRSSKRTPSSQTENEFRIARLIRPYSSRPFAGAAVFLMALAIAFTSCEKPEESVGINLQPEEDIFGVGYTDTVTISLKTVEEDSLRADNITPGLIGAYMDPVFGLTKATHNTELRLTSNNPSFVREGGTMDQVVIDSVVLSLWYAAPPAVPGSSDEVSPVYGGLGPQHFQVFELDEYLSFDSAYYATREAAVIPEDLVLE